MRTLRQILGTASAESYGDFGLELETEYTRDETENAMRSIPPGWAAKLDGSLRNNGLEYVTTGACRRDTKNASLTALVNMLNTHTPSIIKGSPRTSFHVHVNVVDMTPLQITVAITAFYLLEEALLEMCGPYRRGNLHCLPLKEAPSVINDLMLDANSSSFFQTFRQERHKYANLNLATIRRYGTLEVRSMDGGLSLEKMILWTDLLYEIIHTAPKNFKNPKELLDLVYDTNIKRNDSTDVVLARLLETEALRQHVAGLRKDLRDVFIGASRLLMPYIYGVHDWEKVYNDGTFGKVNTTAPPRRGERLRGQGDLAAIMPMDIPATPPIIVNNGQD